MSGLARSRLKMTSLSEFWGTEPEERKLEFPCDSLVAQPDQALFRAVTIAASPAVVFRWLCQLRVAPYSYDWIDNLGRQSPRRLIPGLENLAVGQEIMRDFELVDFARDQHLTLRIKPGSMPQRIFGDAAVSYCVLPREERTSRLLVKIVV